MGLCRIVMPLRNATVECCCNMKLSGCCVLPSLIVSGALLEPDLNNKEKAACSQKAPKFRQVLPAPLQCKFGIVTLCTNCILNVDSVASFKKIFDPLFYLCLSVSMTMCSLPKDPLSQNHYCHHPYSEVPGP